uniref:RRM domain-containing protein n=1 Tax=Rhabditophanes sp. KR3021 TaxID=114890 RepID=A0AC35TIC0_9BILA
MGPPGRDNRGRSPHRGGSRGGDRGGRGGDRGGRGGFGGRGRGGFGDRGGSRGGFGDRGGSADRRGRGGFGGDRGGRGGSVDRRGRGGFADRRGGFGDRGGRGGFGDRGGRGGFGDRRGGRGGFGDRKRTHPDGGFDVVPQEESQKIGANAEGPRAKKQKIESAVTTENAAMQKIAHKVNAKNKPKVAEKIVSFDSDEDEAMDVSNGTPKSKLTKSKKANLPKFVGDVKDGKVAKIATEADSDDDLMMDFGEGEDDGHLMNLGNDGDELVEIGGEDDELAEVEDDSGDETELVQEVEVESTPVETDFADQINFNDDSSDEENAGEGEEAEGEAEDDEEVEVIEQAPVKAKAAPVKKAVEVPAKKVEVVEAPVTEKFKGRLTDKQVKDEEEARKTQRDQCTIHLKKIPVSTTNENLRKLFEGVVSVRIITNLKKASAYLVFDKAPAAQKALKDLASKPFMGIKIAAECCGDAGYVKKVRQDEMKPISRKELFVCGLSPFTSATEIQKAFPTCLPPKLATGPSGEPKNFTFIQFPTEEDAFKAFLKGKNLSIKENLVDVYYGRGWSATK